MGLQWTKHRRLLYKGTTTTKTSTASTTNYPMAWITHTTRYFRRGCVNVDNTNITHILCKINRKYTATNQVNTAINKRQNIRFYLHPFTTCMLMCGQYYILIYIWQRPLKIHNQWSSEYITVRYVILFPKSKVDIYIRLRAESQFDSTLGQISYTTLLFIG